MFFNNKRLLIIFVISLLAHVIIIYVMARSTKLPAMVEMDVKDQPVIQARLIFELPPIAQPPEDKTSEPELPKESQTVPEPVKAQIIEEVTEDTVEVEEAPTEPPLAESSAAENDEPITQQVEAEPFFQKNTPAKETRPQNPLTSMARRHLSHFQQQQRNKVAEQASRAYQQNKNSPIIDEERKDRFLTEDEKFRDSRTIKADCSSTGKKTTAVLLSLFGGQIDCSTPPPVDSFIKNRLNKNAHLPSLQDEQKKRPKSVVIENQE